MTHVRVKKSSSIPLSFSLMMMRWKRRKMAWLDHGE